MTLRRLSWYHKNIIISYSWRKNKNKPMFKPRIYIISRDIKKVWVFSFGKSPTPNPEGWLGRTEILSLYMWAVGFVHMNILNPQNSCVCGTYGRSLLPSLKFYTIPKPENDAKLSACKKTCVFFKVRHLFPWPPN